VSYQGVVDKVSAFYTKNLAQPWQTMFKVFNRCLTTRTSGHDQTKINILQMFHVVINQTNVDYVALLWWDFMNNVNQKKEAIQMIFHWLVCILLGMCVTIKDDIPLVSVYTTGNVLVRGMLIPDAFLTEEIRATDDFKEYETVFMNVDVPMNQPQPVVSTQGTHRSTPRAHRTPTLTASPQGKKRKQSAGESSSPQKSLKITIRQQKVVEGNKDDDDSEDRLEPGSHKDNPEHVDDDDEEKVDEEEGGEMGSLETRTEKMQTPIPTPPRSPRTILSSDKNITQELTETGVSQLAEKAIKELIENNLKPCSAATIIEDRDAFGSEVPDLVSQEFNAQEPKIIKELFKNYVQGNVIQVHPTIITSTETTSLTDLQRQLYFKMKRSLQDRANDPALWEVLKR
ncbi:hypothetical protein Tco_1421390, partial [Tanacetum coccineum]